MNGIERQYLRECIEALCRARLALLDLECEYAVSKSDYGKGTSGDSLVLDASPELAIAKTLKEFDPHLPLITEEIGSTIKLRGTEDEVVCFSDPMDRSKLLAQFLSGCTGKIETIFQNSEMIQKWESENGGNVEISGPYGSITAVRHYYILFNVMINYITGVIYIASDAGVGKISMSDIFEPPEQVSLIRTRDLIKNLTPILFEYVPRKEQEKFVTFCQGEKYENNLVSSKLFSNKTIDQIRKDHLVYHQPGGPARILYLQKPLSCGFILSNGEKIGEWLGWLAYVSHCSPKLSAYEISFDSSWQRDQILMAPGPAYSILGNNIDEDSGLPYIEVQLNLSKLKFLENPSRYRGTILICHESNDNIINRMSIKKYIGLHFVNPGGTAKRSKS